MDDWQYQIRVQVTDQCAAQARAGIDLPSLQVVLHTRNAQVK